jgi:hypothetical protein
MQEKVRFGGILGQMRAVHFTAHYFSESVIDGVFTKDGFVRGRACSEIWGCQ